MHTKFEPGDEYFKNLFDDDFSGDDKSSPSSLGTFSPGDDFSRHLRNFGD